MEYGTWAIVDFGLFFILNYCKRFILGSIVDKVLNNLLTVIIFVKFFLRQEIDKY